MIERRDWLLLFLGADSGNFPTDQIRIMKGMFLLDQLSDHPASGLYRFEPFDYGPFDSSVYRDLDELQLAGFIEVGRRADSTRRSYALTASGWDRYSILKARCSPADFQAVGETKLHVTSLGFSALVKEIYDAFPTFAVLSVARVAQPIN